MTFAGNVNRSMEKVTRPSGLLNVTFIGDFDQGLEKVTLSAGPRNLTFGDDFNLSGGGHLAS